jgi:hypothetical protein
VAEEVQDKERANFCGYFQPHPEAHLPGSDAGTQARQDLDALFGGGTTDSPNNARSARTALDDLFRKDE